MHFQRRNVEHSMKSEKTILNTLRNVFKQDLKIAKFVMNPIRNHMMTNQNLAMDAGNLSAYLSSISLKNYQIS